MAGEIDSIQQAQMRALLGPNAVQGKMENAPVSRSENPVEGPSFSDTLKESIEEVNRLQMEAAEAQEALVTGESRDVHNTIIAMQKADVSFKMMMEVRNKIVDAYKEVMRMQV